jgi:hypothetical protein
VVDGAVDGVVGGLVVVTGAWEVLRGVVVEVGVDWGWVVDWNVWEVGVVDIEIDIGVDAVDGATELEVVKVVKLAEVELAQIDSKL